MQKNSSSLSIALSENRPDIYDGFPNDLGALIITAMWCLSCQGRVPLGQISTCILFAVAPAVFAPKLCLNKHVR